MKGRVNEKILLGCLHLEAAKPVNTRVLIVSNMVWLSVSKTFLLSVQKLCYWKTVREDEAEKCNNFIYTVTSLLFEA